MLAGRRVDDDGRSFGGEKARHRLFVPGVRHHRLELAERARRAHFAIYLVERVFAPLYHEYLRRAGRRDLPDGLGADRAARAGNGDDASGKESGDSRIVERPLVSLHEIGVAQTVGPVEPPHRPGRHDARRADEHAHERDRIRGAQIRQRVRRRERAQQNERGRGGDHRRGEPPGLPRPEAAPGHAVAPRDGKTDHVHRRDSRERSGRPAPAPHRLRKLESEAERSEIREREGGDIRKHPRNAQQSGA